MNKKVYKIGKSYKVTLPPGKWIIGQKVTFKRGVFKPTPKKNNE